MTTIFILNIILGFNVWHFDLSHYAQEDRLGLSPIDIQYHPSSTLYKYTIGCMVFSTLKWIIMIIVLLQKNPPIPNRITQLVMCLIFIFGLSSEFVSFFYILPSSLLYFGGIDLNATEISQRLMDSMEGYTVTERVKKSWDKLQRDCCGVNNCTDWRNLGIAVPKTCGSVCLDGCLNQLLQQVKHEISDNAYSVWLTNLVFVVLVCLLVIYFAIIRPRYLCCLERRVARKTNAIQMHYHSAFGGYRYVITDERGNPVLLPRRRKCREKKDQ